MRSCRYQSCFQQRSRLNLRARHRFTRAHCSSNTDEVVRGEQSLAYKKGKPIEYYRYNAGDGRSQKATIEHVFPAFEGATEGTGEAPWAVGWQLNERNLVWHDDLKLRLIKRIASQKVGITDEELELRLRELTNLVPDLAQRLVQMSPERVAELAINTNTVASRLLRLRVAFPSANISNMIQRRLSLLLDDDIDAMEAAAPQLRELLPSINVDRFVEQFPAVLDVDCLRLAIADAQRLMPNLDVDNTLRRNPDMIMSLMKGKSLIPYDSYLENPWT